MNPCRGGGRGSSSDISHATDVDYAAHGLPALSHATYTCHTVQTAHRGCNATRSMRRATRTHVRRHCGQAKEKAAKAASAEKVQSFEEAFAQIQAPEATARPPPGFASGQTWRTGVFGC